LIGLLSALCTWVLWGHTLPSAVIHDEAAYLLQAKIFAAGACTAPAVPAPEFVEQFHVLVTPFVAAKYPPGHALVLAPGVRLGIPILMPLLLVGLAGALLFALLRPLAGGVNTVLAWALWILAPLNTDALPSYLSEVTTLPLGLAAWLGTARWWTTGGRRSLLVVGFCLGWMAITRPLTAVAWAVPIGIFVLGRVSHERNWRSLAGSLAVGCGVAALWPTWNLCTTGRLTPGPLALYTASYMPWDRPGFGLDSTPPLRTTQPDLEALADEFRGLHRELTPMRALASLPARAKSLVASTYGIGVVLLLPLMLLGSVYARRMWVAIGTGACLLGAYALYAHPMDWNVYYVEILPVLCALPVLGAAWLTGRRAQGIVPVGRGMWWTGLVGYGAIVATIVLGALEIPAARTHHVQQQWATRHFRNRLATLPPGQAIVFVRYATNRDVNASLIQNEPFFAHARVWVAYDRGQENSRLLELAPDRQAFMYDEAKDQLTWLSNPLTAVPDHNPDRHNEKSLQLSE
jgi:hypothetical protein